MRNVITPESTAGRYANTLLRPEQISAAKMKLFNLSLTLLNEQKPMPQLEWNEVDFLKCFEVEPEVEDYETSHAYTLDRAALRLIVVVWQHENVVQLSLSLKDSSETITEMVCFVRGGVRHVNDKRGEYLWFSNCIIGPDRFWYQTTGNLFNAKVHSHGVDIHLHVSPNIQILLRPIHEF